MPDTPPLGCVPCETKIILNGDNVAALTESLCKRIEALLPNQLPKTEALKIIDILNNMEDEILKAQRIFIRAVGYDGPLPKALS